MLPVVGGVAAFTALVTLAIGDAGAYLAVGMQTATAADAAALAAAPATFSGFGRLASPHVEAGRLAVANGAVLVDCRCPVDPSWETRIVSVVVERRIRLALFGSRTVRAVGRAEFAPVALRDPLSRRRPGWRRGGCPR